VAASPPTLFKKVAVRPATLPKPFFVDETAEEAADGIEVTELYPQVNMSVLLYKDDPLFRPTVFFFNGGICRG
jgi:hypothetical protein